jgi:hypothetical protein
MKMKPTISVLSLLVYLPSMSGQSVSIPPKGWMYKYSLYRLPIPRRT